VSSFFRRFAARSCRLRSLPEVEAFAMMQVSAIPRLILVGIFSVFGCGAAAPGSGAPAAPGPAGREGDAASSGREPRARRSEAPSRGPSLGPSQATGAEAAGDRGAASSSSPGSAVVESAGESAGSAGSASRADSANTSASPEAAPLPSLAGTLILHIGDSFAVAGFAQALKPRLKALGARYEVRAETSSYTTSWAAKMEKIVADTQPDLVIINLGANEVENADPKAHAPHVRRIVRAIGARPCVWVSPPLWRKDTGITEVMRESSSPCRFFDSDARVTQPIPRQSDHIHPSPRGGEIWADAFWAWLSGERAPSPESEKPVPWLLKPAPPEEHRPNARGG
jgi:GDSL-like Lipase/Acylhydrolase family